jgi:hypothetical protein
MRRHAVSRFLRSASGSKQQEDWSEPMQLGSACSALVALSKVSGRFQSKPKRCCAFDDANFGRQQEDQGEFCFF